MYFEGKFENNKPKGEGKWVFKNGNVLAGEYDQKEVVNEDDDAEPEEGEEKKKQYTLEWNSHTGIAEAAHLVNSVEQ
jgi:hypothetical protein